MDAQGLIRGEPSGHAAHRLHFLRHLGEMTLAMMLGMVASAAVFVAATGLVVDDALRRHPVSFLLVQVLGMTVPMVAWMRFRGHTRRMCGEMAAAMVIPAVPLVVLGLTGVVGAQICGIYCVAGFAAMLGLMLYRRAEYAH